jgi:hypothetical protein
VEDAIRARAGDRKARIANAEKEAAELRERSLIETLRDRNPADFLNRRADALTQRAADLRKLADAWQPLYQALTPDQKFRLARLELVVLRELRRGVERRRAQSEDEDEE